MCSSHDCDSCSPQCSICLEDIGSKNVATMACGHTFHVNCILRWNFTDKGDKCPLCRKDLGIQNPSLMTEEARNFSIEAIKFEGNESEAFIRTAKNDQKTTLETLIRQNKRNGTNYQIKCGECKKGLHFCDFCVKPFCGCRNTTNTAHYPINPFNKFYNTVFSHKTRDDEMIKIVGIKHPKGDDLLTPRVCGSCFSNRIGVLTRTMDTLSYGGPFTQELFEKTEVKILYYNLFYDNSGYKNKNLRTLIPSYKSYDIFKKYISTKFGFKYDAEEVEV